MKRIQSYFLLILALLPVDANAVDPEAQDRGGIYLAVGNGLHRLSSHDGITWSHHHFVGKPAHDQNDLKSLATGNGVAVAVGGFSRSNILTTRDGVKWHINDFNAGSA